MLLNISSITGFVHYTVENHIKQGDIVIDATAGNGNDTLFLAKNIGINGLVYSFDIQQQAIENTYNLLKKNYLQDRVRLICKSHTEMDLYVKEKIKVCMFNLGYLPGTDRNITTNSTNTINAIKKVCELLEKNGIISIVSYLRHNGGRSEYNEIYKYLSSFDERIFKTAYFNLLNNKKESPVIFFIQKL